MLRNAYANWIDNMPVITMFGKPQVFIMLPIWAPVTYDPIWMVVEHHNLHNQIPQDWIYSSVMKLFRIGHVIQHASPGRPPAKCQQYQQHVYSAAAQNWYVMLTSSATRPAHPLNTPPPPKTVVNRTSRQSTTANTLQIRTTWWTHRNYSTISAVLRIFAKQSLWLDKLAFRLLRATALIRLDADSQTHQTSWHRDGQWTSSWLAAMSIVPWE